MKRDATGSNGEPMPAAQQRAALLLASGKPAGDVAAEVEVDRVTLWRWRQRPDFEAAVNRELHELRQAEADALRAGRVDAVALLRAAVKGEGGAADWPPALRLRAAAELLRQPTPVEPGPTDAAELAARAEAAERQRRIARGVATAADLAAERERIALARAATMLSVGY